MSSNTEKTTEGSGATATLTERLQAAGQLVQTIGQAGSAKLRSSISGRGGGSHGEAKPASDGTAAVDPAEESSAREGGGIGGRISAILGSKLMFRSATGVLIVLAIGQWSLIFFNYWR
ncbi:MAG: hypothetical protein AAF577_08485 [Pseudomonadota bacterium]